MLEYLVAAVLVLASSAPTQGQSADVANPVDAQTGSPPSTPFVIKPESVMVPANGTSARHVRVKIEASFIEIRPDDFNALDFNQYGAVIPLAGSTNLIPSATADPDDPFSNAPASTRTSPYGAYDYGLPPIRRVGSFDVRAAILALSQKTDTNILVDPVNVTVFSGNPANISVAQELRFPKSSGAPNSTANKDRPADAPVEFTTRKVGVELHVTATVDADGKTINLSVEPRVTEFEGFVEYGVQGVASRNGMLPATAKIIATLPATTNYPSGFYQPVFSVHEIPANRVVQDGDTLVLGEMTPGVRVGEFNTPAPEEIKKAVDKLLDSETDANNSLPPKGGSKGKRRMLVFITAKIVP